MANISVSKPYGKNSGNVSTEMHVTAKGLASGAEYEFIVRRHHIEVVQNKTRTIDENGQPIKVKSKGSDWFDTMTDEEKTKLFAVIADQYRTRSLGDNGFRGAAIGVVPKKEKGQSRLFIGTNTTRWALPYFKDCAEQNMVNAATDRLAFEENKTSKDNNQPPKSPNFKAIYVMQGISPDKVPIACPCGKCIDMLANVVEGANTPIITIPLLPKALKEKLDGSHSFDVAIDSKSKTLKEFQAKPKSSDITAWQTTMGNLNAEREIVVAGDERTPLQNARDKMIRAAFQRNKKTTPQREEANLNLLGGKANQSPFERFLATIQQDFNQASDALRKLLGEKRPVIEKATENILRERESEAALDCARGADGTLDLHIINKFLSQKIIDTLADRCKDFSYNVKENRQTWVNNHITSIRCVAIEMDDGSFRYATQAQTAFDNAMPNAEAVALENAVSILGQHGVRHVYAMELNPADIKAGIIRTSPKEGIERLAKRASAQGLDFTYFPPNDGTAPPQNPITRSLEQLYPSGHIGKNGQKNVSHCTAHPRPAGSYFSVA